MMEQRNAMLRELQLNKKESLGMVSGLPVRMPSTMALTMASSYRTRRVRAQAGVLLPGARSAGLGLGLC